MIRFLSSLLLCASVFVLIAAAQAAVPEKQPDGIVVPIQD